MSKEHGDKHGREVERLHGLIENLAMRFKGYLPWPEEKRDAVVRGHEAAIEDTIKKADAIMQAAWAARSSIEADAHAELDKAEISRRHSRDSGATWIEYSLAERIHILAGGYAIAEREREEAQGAVSATEAFTSDVLDAILAHVHGPAWKKVYSLDYEAALRNDLRAVIVTALRRGAKP